MRSNFVYGAMHAEELARALGGKRYGRGWLACCPAHEDRTPSLSICDGRAGDILVHCFAGCSQIDVIEALVVRGLWPRSAGSGVPVRRAIPRLAPNLRRPDKADLVARLWREAVDPRGTLAERYLNGRGLVLNDDLAMSVLRFHGHCPFGKDEEGKTLSVPALIAAFRPFRENDEARPPQAIHRIGLKPDGSKLGKQMLGRVAGAVPSGSTPTIWLSMASAFARASRPASRSAPPAGGRCGRWARPAPSRSSSRSPASRR